MRYFLDARTTETKSQEENLPPSKKIPVREEDTKDSALQRAEKSGPDPTAGTDKNLNAYSKEWRQTSQPP